MGISGLLPFLKKSSSNTHVREFKGCTVAIDAYCWLHKGAFSCADKLVKGEFTDAYVTYCMKMVNMLLSHQIKPILVFDGLHLPSKLVTEVKRRENRERYKIQAREFLRQGNTAKARECFQRCVDVTSEMALQLIKACRAKNVDCIVAPYEADAQLAFLNLKGIAHIVITEDSDLLAFGCHRVFFKMDHNGAGVLIEREKLCLSLGERAEFFNDEKFRRMCILSGCDYLPSLPGIGLGKAFKFFSRAISGDINSVLCRLPSCLNMPKLEVTSEYRDSFVKADQTFLYQLIYDPTRRQLAPLTPYPDGIDPIQMPYAGNYLDSDVAFQLAIGNLDVQTLKPLDNYDPDVAISKLSNDSIWSKEFSCKTLPKNCQLNKVESVQQKHVLTRQTSTKVDINFANKNRSCQLSVISDTELTEQYIKTETPSSPVLSSRKRKRPSDERFDSSEVNDQHVAECSKESFSQGTPRECSQGSIMGSSQATDSGMVSGGSLDSVASLTSTQGMTESTPDRKRCNPFSKSKSPGLAAAESPTSTTSKFSALSKFSQLRKVSADGQEVVTSSYFQTEAIGTQRVINNSQSSPLQKTTVIEQTKQMTINNHSALITNVPSVPKVAPIDSAIISDQIGLSESLSSGCRPSGLSRPSSMKGKTGSKNASPVTASGMRQLNLRDMFACKQ